jgi:hypothetical protein
VGGSGPNAFGSAGDLAFPLLSEARDRLLGSDGVDDDAPLILGKLSGEADEFANGGAGHE